MTVEDILTLPFDEEIVSKTILNTIKKYRYTYKTLMYNRTPVELLDNIFMGDIAKNSLFHYLKNHCKKPVIDYDEIRTDNFENADPGWDFMVGDKKIKVEVKSSIPPNGESKENIIKLRDIKITASHNNGQTWIEPENLEAYIHVQVYFYAKSYKKGYDSFEELFKKINKNPDLVKDIINVSKYSEPLFFGWSTKKEIIQYRKTLKPSTWTFSWTSRIYWKCPISKAHNMPQLIEVIDNN